MTLDAILALVVVMALFLIVIGVQNSVHSTEKTEFKALHYRSEDSIEVLSKKGVLDQICAEWALSSNNQSSSHWANARYIASQYLPRMIPERMGYALYIDGTEVYNDSGRIGRDEANTLTHSSRVLTGYTPGLPVRAYVAKASLNSVQGGKSSSYTYFGGYVGDGNITQKIVLPVDAKPMSAYLELDAASSFSVYVNGKACAAYSPSGTGILANIKKDLPCSGDFTGGDNNVELRFNNSGNNSVGGGYLKVVYETSKMDGLSNLSTYWFPGIKGLINIYSSMYVPGALNSMEIYLHYNSNNPQFLKIGNATVFTGAATGEQTHTLASAQILSNLTAAGLSYGGLSEKTVPVRLGTVAISSSSSSDSMISTDLTEHIEPYLNDVKLEDIHLVNKLLNNSKNRVGLIGYRTVDWNGTSRLCYVPSEGIGIIDHSDLSSSNNSLSSQIMNDYDSAGCCGPAISKAINKSVDILSSQSDCSKSRFIILMSSPCGNDLAEYAYEEVYLEDHNATTYVSGRNGSAIAFNGLTDYVNSSIPQSPANYTIEAWIKLNATGQNVIANFGYEYLAVGWDNLLHSYWPSYANGSTAFALGTWYHVAVTKNATKVVLYLNGVKDGVEGLSSPGSLNTLSIGNTNYPGDDNYHFNGVIDEVRVYNRSLSGAEINTSYKRGLAGGKSNITNGLIAAYYFDGNTSDSSGNGNHGTFHGAGKTGWAVGAADHACQALACPGKNVSIFTIAFGVSGQDSETLMQVAKRCGNGSYYRADDISQLEAVYDDIAGKLSNISYAGQGAVTEGQALDNTLYPDSYIRFGYSPSVEAPQYGEVPLNLESAAFGNTVGKGSFFVPSGSRLVDSLVTSYSGAYWTKNLSILNSAGNWQLAYSLNAYGSDYLLLGDPYTVHIPPSLTKQGLNNVSISIGNSTSGLGGSPDDKVLYTVLAPTFVSSGAPMETSEGCNWTVEFYDGSTGMISAPTGYSGIEHCRYTNASISYDNRSAVNDAIYRLFGQFDTAPRDGRLDIKFDPSALEMDASLTGGVRSMWGPAEVQLVLWMK